MTGNKGNKVPIKQFNWRSGRGRGDKIKFQLISCNREEQCGKRLERMRNYNLKFLNTIVYVIWCQYDNYFGLSE